MDVRRIEKFGRAAPYLLLHMAQRRRFLGVGLADLDRADLLAAAVEMVRGLRVVEDHGAAAQRRAARCDHLCRQFIRRHAGALSAQRVIAQRVGAFHASIRSQQAAGEQKADARAPASVIEQRHAAADLAERDKQEVVGEEGWVVAGAQFDAGPLDFTAPVRRRRIQQCDVHRNVLFHSCLCCEVEHNASCYGCVEAFNAALHGQAQQKIALFTREAA